MADSEKTIAIKFTVDAKTATDNLNKLTASIETIKKELISIQTVSKDSFAKVAESLRRAKESEIYQQKQAVSAGTSEGLGTTKADRAKAIAELDREMKDYNKALSFAVEELRRAASAEQDFMNSMNVQPIENQISKINELNVSLRNLIAQKKIDLTNKAQVEALGKAQVTTYAKERLAQVPLAQPGEEATGRFEATSYAAAKKDISDYRALVKQQLAEIVAEHRAANKQIEVAQKETNKNMLEGERQLTNSKLTLKKEETKLFIDEAKRQREAERAGLSGVDLATKAKEQSDAAIEAYRKANEAYRQQIEERKILSEQLSQTGDEATRKEVENAKKREAALKIEAEALKKNADNATKEYKQIASASEETTKASKSFMDLGNIAKFVFGTILGITAVGALKQMISFLGEASQQALNYTKVIFTLNLAVRQMQRKGDEKTTVSTLTEEIEAFRKEFDYFSKLEVTKAFAEATNKLANLGYTAEQVANVVRIGMIVYTTDLTGRFNDLGEAINGVTNYLASGYGESLERSGFISGRAGDKIAAYEMGLGKTLASLDPLTLSQTRYNLILGQAAEKADDASGYILTLSGAYKQAQADIVDATVNIGRATDDFAVLVERAKARALKAISETKPIKLEIATGDVEQQLILLVTKYKEINKQIQDNNKEITKLSDRGASPEYIKSLEDQNALLLESKKDIEDLTFSLVDLSTAGSKAVDSIIKLPEATKQIAPLDVLDPKQVDDFFSRLNTQLTDFTLGAEPGVVTIEINPELKQAALNSSLEQWDSYFAEIQAKINKTAFTPVTPEADKTKILKYKDDLQNILKEAEDIQNDYTRKSTDIWNDYVNKVGTNTDAILGDIRQLMNYDGTVVEVKVVGSIEFDYEQKVADIEKTFEEKTSEASDKLGSIAQDYADKVAEAQRNYATQLAQSIRQYNIRRAEMERKYRLNELQAERQFQEEMRKLREGYLMDLEGALRERDALQVIRLAREYDLQVTQRKRQYDDEKKTRRENYEEEKKQAAIEQQEREKQLAEELANRLASIKAERDAEKAQAQADKEKALADAQAERDKQIAEANRQLEEGRRQAEIERTGRIQQFQQDLIDQGLVTKDFLEQFGTDLESYFGKGKRYDEIMKFFQGSVADTTNELGNLSAELSKTMGAILGLPSKSATTEVPGFSGLPNPPKIGEPTTAAALPPIEIPTSVSADELEGQLNTAIDEVSKTVAPIEIPTVILPPEGGKVSPSLSEAARSGTQPTTEENPLAIEVPIIVGSENFDEEFQAAMEELKSIRETAMADIVAQDEAEQTELESQAIDRLKIFQTTISEETLTVQEAIKALIEILNNFLGPGKTYDSLMTWYENRTVVAGERVIAIWTRVMAALKALMTIGKTGEEALASIPTTTSPEPRYSGGAEVFTKPTTLQVSEYEPEFVKIIPLSKLTSQEAQDIAASPTSSETAKMLALSRLSKTTVNSTESTKYNSLKNISNSYGSNPVTTLNAPEGKETNNKIQLLVGMEEGLFAKVVDMTLDQAAEIMFDVQRNK